MRTKLRAIVVGATTGVLLVGSVWAGIGLAPAPRAPEGPSLDGSRTARAAVRGPSSPGVALEPGEALAGAAKVNIYPDPPAGETWETDEAKCMPQDSPADAAEAVQNLASPWIENPNCIYTGGYGLGPTVAIRDVHTTGWWARSFAISDGTDTTVLTILDGTYYFGKYKSMCDRCGFFDLAEDLGAELGIDPAGFVFASTHSHSAPDFIGGWGGVPRWYMQQVKEAMQTSVKTAVASMRPAVMEAGEVLARPNNGERRDTYRSPEDPTVNWLRAIDAATGTTIATAGTFAAHPTTWSHRDSGNAAQYRVGHSDWPVLFEQRLEERFGGTGLLFMAGLGNMSARGGTSMGTSLANLVPEKLQGTRVANPDVRAKQVFWDQPVTNVPLGGLGVGGFFDRAFQQTPSTISVSKEFDDTRKPCRSASAISVRTAVSVVKIGTVAVTTAPGEIFANISNSIEEQAGGLALPVALGNDGLGYIMQGHESDDPGRQGLGFIISNITGYEEAYSIDECFGDFVLETIVKLMREL